MDDEVREAAYEAGYEDGYRDAKAPLVAYLMRLREQTPHDAVKQEIDEVLSHV